MRSVKTETFPVTAGPDEAFQAVLGVIQAAKNVDLLAVHVQGRRLVAFERSKMSNQKVIVALVEPQGGGGSVQLAVGTDPRTRKALLDGSANGKLLTRLVEAVRGALDGSAPAPATPVENHYVQGKERRPWVDPTQEPEIEMSFSWATFLTSR